MKVLVVDSFDAAGLDALRAGGCDVSYEPELQGDALTARVRDSRAQVLVVRGTSVNAATLGASTLALVIRAGAGHNTIDTVEAARRGIHVSTCPGRNAAAVAELTIGLMLAIDRCIPENVSDLRAGRWNKKAYSQGRGLAGRTLGLIGYGHIAQEVARRALAFEMRILVWSRRFERSHTRDDNGALPICVMNSPHNVAAEADVLSVHLALTPETRHFVDAAIIGRMKPGAYFINTSRAEVVDTDALADAVTTAGIKAGLDVFDDEPAAPVAHFLPALAALPGVYGTHHVGASTAQAQEAVAAEAVRVALTFKTTGHALNTIEIATPIRR
jgi:D-3-phosphoglycerate dehydrogenase / 2-oxoglutarate reductase